MSRKASPSVLLHKSEVTYRDTGVSKNTLINHALLLSNCHNLKKKIDSVPKTKKGVGKDWMTAHLVGIAPTRN